MKCSQIQQFTRIMLIIKLSDLLAYMSNIIEGVFITDNYRNKGIGKLLLERLKSDYNGLYLPVYEKNEGAIRFYTKHQFEIRSKEFEAETQEYEYLMKWDSN